jgi:HB1, ASXL, restriction endonuclease HTH domain/Restriction endonuclease
MTFTEAAALVLRLCGKPLHYKDITDIAIEKSLLSHVGKSPEVTMGSRLNALLKKSDKENPLQRVKPGVFALREWTEQKINEGLSDKRPPLDCINPEELEAALREASEQPETEDDVEPAAAHVPLTDVDVPEDDEEKHRLELSQGAQDLFAHEEDDDEPIFAVEEDEDAAPAAPSEGLEAQDRAGKRRRRRRRARGRREEGDDTSDDLPTYTVSDADPEETVAHLAREEREIPPVVQEPNDVAIDWVRAVESALGDLEKGRNLVSPAAVLDQMRRKQSLEPGLGAGALLSLMTADNARAQAMGGSPRFKISGGKVGLMSWFGDRRIEEARRAFQRSLDNLKAAQLRSLSEQLARMPQRAVGELVTLLLERMGGTDIKVIRRPGAHGSELHLSANLKLRGLESAWGSLASAIVIRRDGRDVGRERVLELRGSLHHYGSAGHGWLITSGQVLSGAREEAASTGATPVSLTGRTELAELFMEHGLLVQRTSVELFTLDLDLVESLSGGQ